MASVFDVAAYILEKKGLMTAMKLEKLCFYSHAWSLVWDEKQLFPERIEAWANGPVIPALYDKHRGCFDVSRTQFTCGDANNLTEPERQSIDAVLGYYGDKSSQWLSELTHAERPWQEAREGLSAGERGSAQITDDKMAEYYGALI